MTRRYLIDNGTATLDVYVDDDADLDGTFEATDAETGERLRINGWQADTIEEIHE